MTAQFYAVLTGTPPPGEDPTPTIKQAKGLLYEGSDHSFQMFYPGIGASELVNPFETTRVM